MRKVIGIGETVLDIIFKDNKPVEAVPGGSTFNAIISLGRCGVNASFISEAGNDRVGDYIIKFLRENGVNADNVSTFPDSKSPVSLAFLNTKNDAEYIFYKDHPHDQLEFTYPDIQPDDIVIFSSYYAVNPVIRPQAMKISPHFIKKMRLTRSITQRFHSIASSSFTRKEANLWRCVVVRTLKSHTLSITRIS